MKNKAFTLIELLAVIVILAIIALIAVPIVLNIIDDSKNSSNKRSIELYGKAIENAIGQYQVKNPQDKDITLEKVQKYIKYKGNKVECSTTKINIDGTIYLAGCKMDGKEIEYTYGKEQEEKLNVKVEITEGLTPVVYSENSWKIADTSKEWYNYENQEWANAVILNSGITKNIGDTVDIASEVKGMLVYIPRYEYKIEGTYGKGGTSAEQPGEIEVNFIRKETTKASEGYRVHPGFTFGSEELNGIWVGKFETTGTGDNPTILPSAGSLRRENVGEQFETAQKFNSYIINGDSHMAKNSEWGAVAYLSQSKYGKYGNSNYSWTEKEVMINNCSNYITGIGADAQNDEASSTTCTTNTYETSKGQAASTTGNITGIYDMSGGAWEYVMGVLLDPDGNPRSGYNTSINSGYIGMLADGTIYSGKEWPDSKYYETYTSSNPTSDSGTLSETACSGGICYGHALSETSRWYGDGARFVVSSLPWFTRGSDCSNHLPAGLFDFNFYFFYGLVNHYPSFRVVVSPTTN